MRVTGVMLGLSAGSTFNGRLDEGGAMTIAGLNRVEPDVFATEFLVRFGSGVDRRAELGRLGHEFNREVLQRIPAQDVANLQRVDALPGLLAALLAFLALVTLLQ